MADEDKTESPAAPENQQKETVSDAKAPIKKRVVKRKAVKKKAASKKVAAKGSVTKKKIAVKKKVVDSVPAMVNSSGVSSPAGNALASADAATAGTRIVSGAEQSAISREGARGSGDRVGKQQEKREEKGTMTSDRSSTGISAASGHKGLGFWPKIIVSLIIILASFLYIRSLARMPDSGKEQATGAVGQQLAPGSRDASAADSRNSASDQTMTDRTAEPAITVEAVTGDKASETEPRATEPTREASSPAATPAEGATSVGSGGTAGQSAAYTVEPPALDAFPAIPADIAKPQGSEVMPDSGASGEGIEPRDREAAAGVEAAPAPPAEVDVAAAQSGPPSTAGTDVSGTVSSEPVPQVDSPEAAAAAPLPAGTVTDSPQGDLAAAPAGEDLNAAEVPSAGRPDRASGRPSFEELFGYERPTPANRPRPGDENYVRPYPYGGYPYRGRGTYRGPRDRGYGYQGAPYSGFRGYPGYGPYEVYPPQSQEAPDLRYPPYGGYGPYNY